MSVKNKITYKIPPNVVKTVTTSPGVDVRDMMLKDSTDLLDNVEVSTVAQECVKLKQKEDEIASLEEQLKSKKAEADDISSRVIPELLQEQGLSEIKLADGSKVSVKKEFRCTLPKDEAKRTAAYQWLRDQVWGTLLKTMSSLLLEREKMTRRSNCSTLRQKMAFNHNRNLMWLG